MLSLNIPSKYLWKDRIKIKTWEGQGGQGEGGGAGGGGREKNFEGKITSPTFSGEFPLKASLVQRIKKHILE